MAASLALALKIRFGLGPGEPTDAQVQSILADLRPILATRPLTDAEIAKAVYKHCPTAGKWKYAGDDNSDLNSLISQAIQQAKKK